MVNFIKNIIKNIEEYISLILLLIVFIISLFVIYIFYKDYKSLIKINYEHCIITIHDITNQISDSSYRASVTIYKNKDGNIRTININRDNTYDIY